MDTQNTQWMEMVLNGLCNIRAVKYLPAVVFVLKMPVLTKEVLGYIAVLIARRDYGQTPN